jgi:hypothetical protein
MKRFWNVKSRLLMVFTLVATILSGCELLSALAGGLLVNGLSLLGVQPAADYKQSGKIKASMVPTDSSNRVILSSLQSMGLRAQVKGEGGKTNECEFVEETSEIPSVYNSVALLIDDSGSMGLEYPADVCATCPHDPKNLRGDAAQELATVVFKSAPESQLAVFDFGPATDPDLVATRTLTDFTNNSTDISKAIERVDGSVDAGTPLWDSLAETIAKLEGNAEEQDDTVRKGEAGTVTSEGTVKPSEDVVKRYLIVLSDGEDTLSERETIDSVISLAKSKNIPIYAVGLGPASSSSGEAGQSARSKAVMDLQRLAEETGGFYAAVQNAEQTPRPLRQHRQGHVRRLQGRRVRLRRDQYRYLRLHLWPRHLWHHQRRHLRLHLWPRHLRLHQRRHLWRHRLHRWQSRRQPLAR